MAEFVHERAKRNNWLESYHNDLFYGTSNLGAFIRRSDGTYASTAQQHRETLGALEILQPQMAFTMSFTAISIFLTTLEADQKVVRLSSGYLLPVVSSVANIGEIVPDCNRDLGACVCRKEHFILVWGSDPSALFDNAGDVETMLVGKVSTLILIVICPFKLRSI